MSMCSGWNLRRKTALFILIINIFFGLNKAFAYGLLPAFYSPGFARQFAPLMVVRQAPPPIDNFQTKLTYPFGPITESVSLNVAQQNLSSWTQGHIWPMVWANRARVPSGYTLIPGNPTYPYIRDQFGNLYLTEFTTPARANAVTTAQVLYIIGAPASVWQAPLLAVGLSPSDAIPWATAAANPQAYFKTLSQDGKSMVTLDKMVIPFAVSSDPYGVMLDYEVQDHRSTSEAHDFLDAIAATVRGYGLKIYLYTNPWESSSTQSNGFSFARMDEIKANFDYISLYIWGEQYSCDFNNSYLPAVNFLKGVSGRLDFSQILITFDMKLCTEATAIQLFNQRAQDGFSGYNLFADGAVEGSPNWLGTNEVLWALMYGD